MAAEDEVRTFLHKNNLGQYFESFIEQGYDDLKQIICYSNSFEELDNLMKDVGLFSKLGHKKRFLAAVKIEASKSMHGIENEIPSVSASNRETNENNPKECAGNNISKCKYVQFPVLLNIEHFVCAYIYWYQWYGRARFAYAYGNGL